MATLKSNLGPLTTAAKKTLTSELNFTRPDHFITNFKE